MVYQNFVRLRTRCIGRKIYAKSRKNAEITMKNKKKERQEKPIISKADQDMINELDYEYKKAHKPYDKWERHWDEA